MDDDALSMRNWGYYEQPPLKGHLGLQLMSPVTERDTKSFLSGSNNPIMVAANGAFRPRDCVVTEPPVTHMDYVRDSWINHRDKFLHMFPGNSYNPVFAEPSGSHSSMQILGQPDTTDDAGVTIEEPSVKKAGGPAKKRSAAAAALKPTKAKKSSKVPSVPKENGNSSVHRAKTTKKNLDVVINGIDMDISGIPIPVCSCTGNPQQCYRWGCGGWQSACCTTTISMYPLPMSNKRRGARIAGRKMSQGAFKKVLEKLASEDYNFTNPIDLKTYWAKHGTNKFVTIR
ncbi:protein BASIC PENTACYSTEINE2-like [Olea europaea var. sylvestris]|uniref:protein BASIC PENTACYSTEINE2-like n=1 Tax=Olea europaea var. sylvestris TaxID=158386 RepID=UPI000C1D77FC|nr:protein BASIC PENTACYSTEINE2-like [Olea europaea var. sylvestris]